MTLYPPVEPFFTAMYPVSKLHSVYYEQSGNPRGYPVLFLHGGPGGGTSARDRQFFDPSFYRIILIDQRGSGKSTPHAALEENNTWALVDDIEKIRAYLGIESWLVFGGSWGSTLSLVYAEEFPERVTGLILRGIFMLRREELLWFYQEGASFVFADYWDGFVAPIPHEERKDMMAAYYKRLTGSNEAERNRCAAAWTRWEMATAKLYVDPETVAKADDGDFALAFARIECHYFVNGGFFDRDDHILANAHKLKNIPTTIVHGRYDMVCPYKNAVDLKKALPEATLITIKDSGHSAKEPGIQAELVAACDRFRDHMKTQTDEKARRLPPAGVIMHHVEYPETRYNEDRIRKPQLQSPIHAPHKRTLQPPGGASHNIFG